jgi:ketosteroid isomerase-like protein
MENQAIRAAIDQHCAASAADNLDAEHEIYSDDVVVEYPHPSQVGGVSEK